jgi:hypothetical protein
LCAVSLWPVTFSFFLESSQLQREVGQVAGLMCTTRKGKLEVRPHQALDTVSEPADDFHWRPSEDVRDAWHCDGGGELSLHVDVHMPRPNHEILGARGET